MDLFVNSQTLLGLCVALGIGLLIGAERERRKDTHKTGIAAGIRTFAVVALLGAVSILLGEYVFVVVTLIVGGSALLAYRNTSAQEPGLTTELSLFLTCLLGGLAIRDAALAAGIGAVLALLLAARNRIHYFVRKVLTEQELHDVILFSAAALIALPLAPDRFMGPFDAFNPHAAVQIIVLVMAISALGYIAMRLLGPRFGLPLAGFASGFVSSTATIFSMGTRVSQLPSQMPGAVAGAVLSSIATIIQMTIVIASIQPSLLANLAKPLALGGLLAFIYGLIFVLKAMKQTKQTYDQDLGRAFDLKTAVGFATIISLAILIAAFLNNWLGVQGLNISTAATGLVDAHAAAVSVASLVSAQKITSQQAVWPVLIGLSSNTLMKAIVAYKSGGLQYASRIVPGLVLMIAAVWVG
ncbi:MAG TPA: MgtC/SapB family protein, partial [Burkholderiaceae bacterium]|nr:MgtC/SapB family protein [Burkholderiaceae bacterium]